MNKDIEKSILDIVHACADVQFVTNGIGAYPETRHLMNALNVDAPDLNLYFITTVGTPKYEQLERDPRVCLYYFNPNNRHAVRLFGVIDFVVDADLRRKFWRDEYKDFGYTGADDKRMVLMHFAPDEYKFYIGDELKTGKIA